MRTANCVVMEATSFDPRAVAERLAKLHEWSGVSQYALDRLAGRAEGTFGVTVDRLSSGSGKDARIGTIESYALACGTTLQWVVYGGASPDPDVVRATVSKRITASATQRTGTEG